MLSTRQPDRPSACASAAVLSFLMFALQEAEPAEPEPTDEGRLCVCSPHAGWD